MRTLFVDFDGTICHDRFWRGLQDNEQTLIQDFLFTGKNSIVRDWMKGMYSSEEINTLVAVETGISYEYLWDTFVNDCKTMHIQDEILKLIQRLRNTFHVVLITGNMDCFNRFTTPSLQLERYFDVIVNSFDEKQLKTDNNGASFIKYVRGQIQDAILIEDSEKSCDIFNRLGGTAHRVSDKDDTVEHLQKLIVLDNCYS